MTPTSRMPALPRLPALTVALLLICSGCSADPGAEAATRQTTASTPARTGTTTPSPTPRAAPAGAPVTIIGAGDIAGDVEDARSTAALISAADPAAAVYTTGDNAYPDGSRSDYLENYHPTWGPFKDRTHPVPGNHEYRTDGAAGYLEYFGAENVTNSVDGGLYYAWDVGNAWRAYAVNTEISTTGAQLAWLQDDVAAHPGRRYILYGHRPPHTSGSEHGPSDAICPLWDALAATGGLEIVLTGHNHQYERFAPMDCAGRASADGPRSFVIGSGGKSLYGFGTAERGSEFRNDTDLGVLELVLHEDSYEWEFIAAGRDGSGGAGSASAGQILDKGTGGV